MYVYLNIYLSLFVSLVLKSPNWAIRTHFAFFFTHGGVSSTFLAVMRCSEPSMPPSTKHEIIKAGLPGQTIVTFQCNILQHCQAQHTEGACSSWLVAKCGDMLGVVGSSLKMAKF